MFSNHLNKTLRDLEREINTKENALSQLSDGSGKHVIVSRPANKPLSKKPSRYNAKEGKTSISETNTKRNIVGKPHSSGYTRRSVLTPVQNQDVEEKVIHKEIIENSGATVEITVRTKPIDRTRARSRSRSRVRKGAQPGEDLSSKMRGDDGGERFHLPLENKCTTYHKRSERNHRPWCELLKSRDTAFTNPSVTAVEVNHNHLMQCAGIPKSADVNERGESSTNVNEAHAPSHTQLSSKSTVDNSTSRIKSCKNVGASSSVTSGQRPMIERDLLRDSADNCGSTCDSDQYRKDIKIALANVDPIRVLNFLVTELQGILSNSSLASGRVMRIFGEMEDTLKRLHVKNKCVKCQQPATSLSCPSKSREPAQSTPGREAVEVVALRETVRQSEARCGQLATNKEQLEAEVTDKRKRIEILEIKEREYQQKIYELTEEMKKLKVKNDDQLKMLTNFSNLSVQLTNENKEAQSKMASRLREANQCVARLEMELQVARLDSEKYRLMLEDRSRDVEGLKQLVKNIQLIVSEQLTNLKHVVPHKVAKDQLDSLIRAVSECSVKMGEGDGDVAMELPEGTQVTRRNASRPHCSSPSSSVVSSRPAISPTWQMISDIASNNDEEDDRVHPSVVLAHGVDSDAESCHLDETVRFDDSEGIEAGDHRRFRSLPSVDDSTTPERRESRSVSNASSASGLSRNDFVQVCAPGSRGVDPEPVEENSGYLKLCKVFQEISQKIVFRSDPMQLFQEHGASADNSSKQN
ncbi:uncharacterized protein LOC134528185 isoform X2 [Bacillus rossius redtenbacheri]|uniref:uncharacterized protein LOC134528185 isoform X2 n=1 Tax=Bacillus rossius redtenbacheri TaxID=93214 RepID=UPI002FDEB8EB